MLQQRLLVTGGSGFIGKALAVGAASIGFEVRISSRQELAAAKSAIDYTIVRDMGPSTNWSAALQEVNTVVHCAGRAHVMNEKAENPSATFRSVNFEATLNLARQAVEAGVRRFIFLSSVGVNGFQTTPGNPFSEEDEPKPHNAYALSKWEAEQGLLRIADEVGLELVIIRPPLVYGLGAPGNFGSLTRAVQRGWPLPLGVVHNKRSLIALDNLVDFIITCVIHPQAANQTFLVSDGQDLSTVELVLGMASAAGIPARVFPVPLWALQKGAAFLGKGDAVQRLCGDLQVDIFKAKALLGWVPPVSVYEGLKKAMGR